MQSNGSFEPPCGVSGPRLAAACALWPAAQLNRWCDGGRPCTFPRMTSLGQPKTIDLIWGADNSSMVNDETTSPK